MPPVNPNGSTFPVITFNNSTGSDTQASGSSFPASAVFGTMAATHANTTVNITDAVALGGVAVDGSAVLWISSSSGRQWSPITAISGSSGNWTVTVSTAYANTESSRTWAIGGQRLTLDNAHQLGADYLDGWYIDVNQTGVDYSLTTAFHFSVTLLTNPVYFTSSSVTKPIIKTSVNSLTGMIDLALCVHLRISNLYLKYIGAGGSVRGVIPIANTANYIFFDNLVIDGFFNGIDSENAAFATLQSHKLQNVEIKNCTNYGYVTDNSCNVHKCYIHGNTVSGIKVVIVNGIAMIADSVIDSNGTSSGNANVWIQATNSLVSLQNCDITNSSGGDGVLLGTAGTKNGVMLVDSIVYGNAQYGCDFKAAPDYLELMESNCAYGANGTANRRGFSAGSGAITLTANPFKSSTDFGLNATAGGGPLCKGAATTIPSASANAAGDVGAIPSGGGGTSGATAFAF